MAPSLQLVVSFFAARTSLGMSGFLRLLLLLVAQVWLQRRHSLPRYANDRSSADMVDTRVLITLVMRLSTNLVLVRER